MDRVTDDVNPGDGGGAAAVDALIAEGALDALFARIDAGEVALTGSGGFVPELIRAALERGLKAELTEQLGYEKGDPAAAEVANSRNGSSPKTLASQVGPVPIEVPRGSGSCRLAVFAGAAMEAARSGRAPGWLSIRVGQVSASITTGTGGTAQDEPRRPAVIFEPWLLLGGRAHLSSGIFIAGWEEQIGGGTGGGAVSGTPRGPRIDGWSNKIPKKPGVPPPPEVFIPPTNPAQLPPRLPLRYSVRGMPLTKDYPNGYFVVTNSAKQPVNMSKPFSDGSGWRTPANASKAQARAKTHVPLPQFTRSTPRKLP